MLATFKPDDVQRTLRSESKAIKFNVNLEEKQIANKNDKIDVFEFVWTFFDAVDPRVRAELESKMSRHFTVELTDVHAVKSDNSLESQNKINVTKSTKNQILDLNSNLNFAI
ncbi:hypothetical protein BpHYR1_017838 [Brachionus plicatilis]|uniref:Uncharacterized protein n=1 Tax=Brachionus plicatilis TaxID=10195 RepID=A0A3M7PSS8_BRAPC|nr:hypothetical protein BpHYR1_017838 [Brachionus plicatilis]